MGDAFSGIGRYLFSVRLGIYSFATKKVACRCCGQRCVRESRTDIAVRRPAMQANLAQKAIARNARLAQNSTRESHEA
jgi:hypothetical protein